MKPAVNKVKGKSAVVGKDLYPDIIVKKSGENLDQIVTLDDKPGVSALGDAAAGDTSVKDALLALKLQAEEQAREIQELRKERTGNRRSDVEIEERIEAKVAERLERNLQSGLHDSEERQELFFRIASRKFDRPFKGEFKWASDRRFYEYIQELKSVLEEAFIDLQSDLPGESKAWNPLKLLAGKLQGFEEDIVTAQV